MKKLLKNSGFFWFIAILVALPLVFSACSSSDAAPNVTPDGSGDKTPTEQISEEQSRQIAEKFVKNSPTFKFDGMDDTLKLVNTITLQTPLAREFIFEFDSRHSGYGDRTGQILLQVITPHNAVITVIDGQVVTAIMDARWDMLKQEMITQPDGNPASVPPLDHGVTPVQIELTYDELLNQKHIVRDVEVVQPGSLIVILGANPTTGFQWQEAVISDTSALEQYSRQFVEPQASMPGAAGKDVWTFKTLNKGTSTVEFNYSRPWEGGEKGEWTVSLTVTVK